jgi:hypothetical protein
MKRPVSSAALAAALATLALAPTALADEYGGAPPPSPATPLPHDIVTIERTVPNAGLISSGVVTLGFSYGPSVIVAAASDRPEDKNLFIPLAGPWIDLANRKDRCVEGFCPSDAPNQVLLVANGLFQGIGALEVLGGFLFPTRKTVTRAASIGVRPHGGLHEVGLTAFGSF